MGNIHSYGELFTTDVLVIGGGISGLATAIRVKQNDPSLDVLVVEKGYAGWSGQATKSGNGIRATADSDSGLAMAMGYLVNCQTEFLNDQDFLEKYLEVHKRNVEFIKDCGVKVPLYEDGSIFYFDFVPGLKMAGIEINNCRSLRATALGMNIRILNCVNIFELLTGKNGRAIGAIGFDMEKGECKIFQAKAIAMATQGCHFKKIGLEFMGYGTGVGAAYRAGAVMRNVEFSTQTDVVFKKNNTPIYGGFNLLYNRLGENIKDKYCGKAPLFEVSTELVMGMLEEIKLGNGPITCDLEHPDELRRMSNAPLNPTALTNMMRDKIAWEHHVADKTNRVFGDIGLHPEASIKMVLQVEPIKVDIEYKTDVEGLWAPGKISTQGCAYFGWTRGDGVGNASTTAMMAGDSMAKYAAAADAEELNPDQVKAYKEKIYAPLNRKTGHKPKEIFDMIERYIFDVGTLLAKSEESIHQVLSDVEEMKKILPELTADDPHTLAKCLEAADTILALEMVFRAADMRKETRGQMYPHYRVDYPQHDDANWLKWINIHQGKNGEMELFTEEVPLWQYPIRPEGYVIPEGHTEEFYVEGNPAAKKFIEMRKALSEQAASTIFGDVDAQ